MAVKRSWLWLAAALLAATLLVLLELALPAPTASPPTSARGLSSTVPNETAGAVSSRAPASASENTSEPQDAPLRQTHVRLPSGTKVLGVRKGRVRSFHDVRYARAERFGRPRLEVARFGETIDARPNNQSSVCPQLDQQSGQLVGSEDCLFLDIYAPPKEYRNQAVMVWIHGGWLTQGSKQADWGEIFVDEGSVLVVAINYRLNVFGFWTDLNQSAPKNFGIRDQIVALEWVRDNIQSFGGDPSRVTVFGESGGGTAILALYQSPLARGLFQQGIAQSPSARPAYFQANSTLAAETMGKACLEALGCNSSACLRNRTAAELLSCSDYFRPKVFTTTPGMYFAGFDGEVVQDVLAPFCSATETVNGDRPLMVGSLTDEWRLFAAIGINSSGTLDTFLAERLAGYGDGGEELRRCAQEQLLKLYANVKAGFCSLCNEFEGKAPLVQLVGDVVYTQGAQLAAATLGAAHYRYLLDLGPMSSPLGSTHGVDLCFFYKDPWRMCLNDGRQKAKYYTGRLLRELWTSFAVSGAPRSSWGVRWDPVGNSSGSLGLPLLRVKLGVRGRGSRMSEQAWHSDEAAGLLANLTCSRVTLSSLDDGPAGEPRCELVSSDPTQQ